MEIITLSEQKAKLKNAEIKDKPLRTPKYFSILPLAANITVLH
jgi:hypothetical protein